MSTPKIVGLRAETLNACDSSLSAMLFDPFTPDELNAIMHDPRVRFYAEAIIDLELYGRLFAGKKDFIRDKIRRINNLIDAINCEYRMLYLIDFKEAHRQKMILRRMRVGIRRAARNARGE